MSKYIREGLGKAWYETLLDVAGEAGAAVVEGYGGKAAGDAVRGVHKGWTQAAFHSNDKPAAPPPPPPPPRPAPPPRYAPLRPPPIMRPLPPPPRPQMMTLPVAFTPPPAGPPPSAPKSGSAMKTVLIVGGVGLGAAAIYLLTRGRR